MASFFTIVGSLLTIASSQCSWTVTNPHDGSTFLLNLTPLQGVTLNITDTETDPHHYLYSICQNKEICDGENVMTKITMPNDPSTCYVLGRWDHSKVPMYDDYNGDPGWRFTYDNGAEDCGNPARTWAPKFICDPSTKYNVGKVDEVPNSCYYEVSIHTKFACANLTTTTTSAPEGECIFKSENGNHTLNMTSIRGKLLMEADEQTGYLYYMYTPCANSAKCNEDKAVMAYLYDGMNFECKQYLAIWEGGYTEPNYIEGVRMWQFTYTNGQSCNGGQSVFNVEWFCDNAATSPKVIQAKEIATCVYQMVINSTLACE